MARIFVLLLVPLACYAAAVVIGAAWPYLAGLFLLLVISFLLAAYVL